MLPSQEECIDLLKYNNRSVEEEEETIYKKNNNNNNSEYLSLFDMTSVEYSPLFQSFETFSFTGWGF